MNRTEILLLLGAAGAAVAAVVFWKKSASKGAPGVPSADAGAAFLSHVVFPPAQFSSSGYPAFYSNQSGIK